MNEELWKSRLGHAMDFMVVNERKYEWGMWILIDGEGKIEGDCAGEMKERDKDTVREGLEKLIKG